MYVDILNIIQLYSKQVTIKQNLQLYTHTYI